MQHNIVEHKVWLVEVFHTTEMQPIKDFFPIVNMTWKSVQPIIITKVDSGLRYSSQFLNQLEFLSVGHLIKFVKLRIFIKN